MAEASDRFGFAMAAGDFNGDGFDDLAVGAAMEAVGDVTAAYAVNILYGSAAGLTSAGNQIFDQETFFFTSEESEYMGNALAAGDFNGDGRDDLAIGIKGDRQGGYQWAGSVFVVRGSIGGLDPLQYQRLDHGGDADYLDFSARRWRRATSIRMARTTSRLASRARP
ncbi:MAG: FG-GAP repeat protein [Verrucomicrobiales bacterium]